MLGIKLQSLRTFEPLSISAFGSLHQRKRYLKISHYPQKVKKHADLQTFDSEIMRMPFQLGKIGENRLEGRSVSSLDWVQEKRRWCFWFANAWLTKKLLRRMSLFASFQFSKGQRWWVWWLRALLKDSASDKFIRWSTLMGAEAFKRRKCAGHRIFQRDAVSQFRPEAQIPQKWHGRLRTRIWLQSSRSARSTTSTQYAKASDYFGFGTSLIMKRQEIKRGSKKAIADHRGEWTKSFKR